MPSLIDNDILADVTQLSIDPLAVILVPAIAVASVFGVRKLFSIIRKGRKEVE